MKNLLTIAIVLSSVSAFATRARVTALGNSPHLIDVAQSSPDQLMGLGDSLTIESGVTATTLSVPTTTPKGFTGNNANSEGSLYKSLGEGKLGLVLGHQDTLIYTLRSMAFGTVATKAQQNPLEVSYSVKLADMGFSAGIIYSDFNDKVASEKESSMGVRVGVSNSLFYGNVKLIAVDKYEITGSEYKGKMGIDLKGGMNFGETLSVHGNVASVGYKTTVGAAETDVEAMLISVKLVDAIKKDGNNFFYGAGLSTMTSKETVGNTDTKASTLNMPLIIGVEAPAASWLTLRASVSQDVLLSNEKTEVSGPAPSTTSDTNPGLNSTKFAAGASLVFNKVSIDGTLTNDVAANNQTINSKDLLGTVGLTYNF